MKRVRLLIGALLTACTHAVEPKAVSQTPAAAAPAQAAPATSAAAAPGPAPVASPAVDVAKYGLSLPEAAEAMPDAYQDAPQIVGQGARLFVDGEPAGNVREILDTGRLHRLDEVFELLKARRNQWRAQHPGAPFPGLAVLWFDQTTPLVVFKSVFQTAAFAGYPSLQVAVRSRGPEPKRTLYLPFEARVPAPPSAEAPPRASFELHVEYERDGRIHFAWKALTRVEQASSFLEQASSEERLAQLPRGIEAEWTKFGGHRSKDDRQLDQATIHVPSYETLATAVSVLESSYAPKRDYLQNGQLVRVPAFNVTFSVN